MPKVSVLMPVYNAEEFLELAIHSILNQTFKDFELIIVNDGSKDNSENIIKQIEDNRIQYYRNEGNKGVAYTRNRLVDLARTDYIAWMDADDISMPDRLQSSYDYLMQHADVDMVHGRTVIIDENGIELETASKPIENPLFARARIIFNNVITNGSVMIRKSVYTNNDLRYVECYGIEDYRMWTKIAQKHNIVGLNELMYQYRILDTSLSRSVRKIERDETLDCIHKSILDDYQIILKDNELDVFLKMTREGAGIETKEEVELLYQVLQSMLHQFKNRNVEFVTEFAAACRLFYAEKLAKARCLWRV